MKIVLILLLSLILHALDHNECMKKLKELEALQPEKKTALEGITELIVRTAVLVKTGNTQSLSPEKQDRRIKERIRVLKLELRQCK